MDKGFRNSCLATAVAQVINEMLSKSPSGKMESHKVQILVERMFLPSRPRPAVALLQ